MNLLFEIKENQVIDICSCINFSNGLESIEPELYLDASDYDFLDDPMFDNDNDFF